MKLVNIGSGNMVAAERIVSVVKERGTLIDATHGRKTKTVIIADSGHIILTYIPFDKLANRISDSEIVFEEEDYE